VLNAPRWNTAEQPVGQLGGFELTAKRQYRDDKPYVLVEVVGVPVDSIAICGGDIENAAPGPVSRFENALRSLDRKLQLHAGLGPAAALHRHQGLAARRSGLRHDLAARQRGTGAARQLRGDEERVRHRLVKPGVGAGQHTHRHRAAGEGPGQRGPHHLDSADIQS
jgi:hypothetical protein